VLIFRIVTCLCTYRTMMGSSSYCVVSLLRVLVKMDLFYVRFEVFTAVTMKNAVFWDVAPCRSCLNRRSGGTYRLHLQGKKIRKRGTSVGWCVCMAIYCSNSVLTVFRLLGYRRQYMSHSCVICFY
jgi:hypothetical protein